MTRPLSSAEISVDYLDVTSGRIRSIDCFRGIAIVLMVLGNFAAEIRWVPGFLKHSPDIGFTVADLVAPMFILAIALTAGPAIQGRRMQIGASAAAGRMAKRSLMLIGIGAVIAAGQAMMPGQQGVLSWGVLQCIGASSLLLLTVIFQPGWLRLIAGLACLVVYQLLLDRFFLQTVLQSAHNGLAGTISWAGFLMIGTAAADCFHARKNFNQKALVLILSGILAAGAALILARWIPVSKNRASATYMLLSLGLCLLIFAVFHIIFDGRHDLMRWLQRIGRNPLALYLAHLLMLGLVKLPNQDSWHAGAPIWLSLIQAGAILTMLVGLSAWLERKNWILRL